MKNSEALLTQKIYKSIEFIALSRFPKERQSHPQHIELTILFLDLGKPPERRMPYHVWIGAIESAERFVSSFSTSF